MKKVNDGRVRRSRDILIIKVGTLLLRNARSVTLNYLFDELTQNPTKGKSNGGRVMTFVQVTEKKAPYFTQSSYTPIYYAIFSMLRRFYCGMRGM